MKAALFVTLIMSQLAAPHAQQGMEIGLAMPYSDKAIPGRPVLSLSGFLATTRPLPGFAEYGFLAMLPFGAERLEPSAQPLITEAAGMYAGQLFVPFQGLVRPGFDLGWLWERNSNLARDGIVHSNRQLSLYYAFKLQFSCLTFLVSNIGMGGGINFSL